MRALEATARAAEDPTRTLPMVIGELGQKLGEKPALLSDRETMSFATLAQRMNLYSRWAIAEGVKPGDSVCLLMPNRPEYLAIWLGITQVGGIVALLNTNLTGQALAHCIAVAAPAHIIVAAELAEFVRQRGAASRRDAENLAAWRRRSAGGRASTWRCRRWTAANLSLDERRDVRHADRALLIYTSGTTGLPKAAHVSHHRIMMWSYWFAGLADIKAGRPHVRLPAALSQRRRHRGDRRALWSAAARSSCRSGFRRASSGTILRAGIAPCSNISANSAAISSRRRRIRPSARIACGSPAAMA